MTVNQYSLIQYNLLYKTIYKPKCDQDVQHMSAGRRFGFLKLSGESIRSDDSPILRHLGRTSSSSAASLIPLD